MKPSFFRSATALVCAMAWTSWPGHVAAEVATEAETRPIVLFSADNGVRGAELWVTDGTRRGTRMLRDLFRGPVGSYPEEITVIADGLAVFRAEHPRAGVELWVTDGTREGTQLVQNITRDSGSSWPWGFTALGDGRALFAADDGRRGTELWVTDGTRAGTGIVQNIGGDGSAWPTDITAIGNGRAVFAADHPERGRQVWISDGTRQGTSIVRVIAPGGSHPWGFERLGDQVLFTADDGVRGAELWATDGTREGTRLVRNINRDGASWPSEITAIGNGLAVFAADNGRHGGEPWVTDGTREGTEMLRNINQFDDRFGEWPGMFTPLGDGRALFAADNGWTGVEPWVTDGTRAGTRMIQDINPGPDSSHPGIWGHQMAVGLGDGRALFMAVTPEHGGELWITDGTPRGTRMVRDINPGPEGSWPDNMVLFGNLPTSHPLVAALDQVAEEG